MKNTTVQTDEHALLTIAEIAKRFSLPESTARYYCKRFLDFLPHIGEGKRRRYRGNALEVFTVIVDEMKKSKNAMAVEVVLSSAFPRNASIIPTVPQRQQQDSSTAITTIPGVEPTRIITAMEQQASAITQIASILAGMQQKDAQLVALQEKLAASEGAVDSLRNELKALKLLQSETEKLHQQDLDQMRKWLGRIATEKKTTPEE